LQFILVFGVGLFLSIAAVYYRDMINIWEVILQAGFFLAPVMYSLTMIPDKYLGLYLINPMARLMAMYREIFLYGTVPGLWDYAIVFFTCMIILVSGYLFFKRYESRIAEVL
jgi:ABC-type polysaccharide/polyol phosphate export permease